MKYHLNSMEEVEGFIKSGVLITSEAMEILGVNRSRMNAMVKTGMLSPVNELGNMGLILKIDIDAKKRDRRIKGEIPSI